MTLQHDIREWEQLQLFGSKEVDPHGKSLHELGAKADAGKNEYDFVLGYFSQALAAVNEVAAYGAKKYTPNGWAEVPDGANRYMEAFGRHLMELGSGQEFDNGPKGLGPDIYHKAQMIWNLLASLELELREKNG